MSRAGEFWRELDDLFDRRTTWLRSVFERPRPGKPRKLARKHVQQSIARLQALASEEWAHDFARREFQDAVEFKRSWHPKRGKGWGRDAKRTAFDDWFGEEVRGGPTIYAFWNRKRCVYVGKTTGSGRRVSSHFVKHWFSGVTRIDVYAVKGTRKLPALECLGIHRFQPSRNKFRAERRKWTTKCALCETHRAIDEELRAMFRLK
jgi:hypothetical protein